MGRSTDAAWKCYVHLNCAIIILVGWESILELDVLYMVEDAISQSEQKRDSVECPGHRDNYIQSWCR